MAKASPTEASEQPVEEYPQPSYVGDEWWGHGGSYLLGPDGKRSLIVEPAAAPIQSPESEA